MATKKSTKKPVDKLTPSMLRALEEIANGDTQQDGRTLNALRARKLVTGTLKVRLTVKGDKALLA